MTYPQGGGYDWVMFDRIGPVAVVTVDETVALVPVVFVEGAWVDRRDGRPIDLVSLVTILGLPESVPV